MTKIIIIQGDITTQHIDVIVNAANKSLLGGGVDGAIHRAAGPKLLEACRVLGGCKTGEVKLTKGYNLPAKYVIHTVGPIYGNEHGREAELLASCYSHSLFLAKEHGVRTIAFPAISTGAYDYPKEEAAQVVHKVINDFITKDDWFDEIQFVLHSEEVLKIYKHYFKK